MYPGPSLPLVQPAPYRPDKGDRRELWRALERLAPAGRVQWLRLCCKKACPALDVVSSSGEVADVLGDFYTICGQNGLSLAWAVGLAEHLCRGKDPREFPATDGLTR